MGRPPKSVQTPQDKKQTEQEYLAEHPNATPYELLTAEIITQARFAELDKMPDPVQQKVKPTIVIQKPIEPQLTSFTVAENRARVYLKDKTNGKSTLMSRGSAEREVKKYPRRYEII